MAARPPVDLGKLEESAALKVSLLVARPAALLEARVSPVELGQASQQTHRKADRQAAEVVPATATSEVPVAQAVHTAQQAAVEAAL